MADIERFPGRGQRRGRATGSGNGNGGTLGERSVALETDMQHVATKADLKNTENRLIRWMLGTIMVATVGLSLAVLRALLP